MEKQRKYDQEFKFNAVKLYHELGKNLRQVANNLGISKSTLSTWIKQNAMPIFLEPSVPGKMKL